MESTTTLNILKAQDFYNYRNPLNLVTSILMILNCIFGVSFNTSIIFILFSNKNERTSFDIFSLARSFNNNFVLIIGYIIVFIPITLIGTSFLSAQVESFLINISINCSVYNLILSFFVTINRFIAIYFPIGYSNIFKKKLSWILVSILYIDRLRNLILESLALFPLECFSVYYPEYLTYFQNSEENCHNYNGSVIVISTAGLLLLIVIINAATFLKAILYLYSSRDMELVSNQRIRKNISLFFQTCLQDFLIVLDTVFTFKLSLLSDHRFWSFICGTFVWQSVHTFDGLIMMMFSDRLQTISGKIWKLKVASAVSTISPNDLRRITSVQ